MADRGVGDLSAGRWFTESVDIDALTGKPKGDYPSGAVAIRGAANVANASAVATLAAPTNGQTVYISGFEVTAGGATAASLVTVTIANTMGGALQYTLAVPAGATTGAQPLIVTFAPPIPANAANTAITVTVPALGAGNTACTVNAHGYQL